MNKRKLGKTGIEIPEIGMGCWAISGVGYGPVSETEALMTLEAAWNGGVRFFDTADTYGEGHSEKLIAKFLRDKNRGEAVIASKAGVDFYHGGHKKNFEPDYLYFACEESLKRLETDYIDFYQLHNPGSDIVQKGEAVAALIELKKSGKIKYIGLSLHTVDETLWAIKHVKEIDSLQIIFNIFDQRMRIDVFERAKEKGIAVIAREPLASGILTGKHSSETLFPKDDHRRRYSKEKLVVDSEKLAKIQDIVQDVPLAQAALEFALSEPAVNVIIPGAKTQEQMHQNLKAAAEPRLTKEMVQALRRLFGSDPLFQKHLLPSK